MWTLGIYSPNYLDIGAHHPFDISNTALMYSRGCRGVNVEANPNLHAAFLAHRPDDINVNVGVASKPGTMPFYMFDETSGLNTFCKDEVDSLLKGNSGLVVRDVKNIAVITLADILKTYCDERPPDFLNVDVEGLDYDVLSSYPFVGCRPAIVCTEAWHHRAEPVIKYMAAVDYRLVTRLAANLIFVAGEHHPRLMK